MCRVRWARLGWGAALTCVAPAVPAQQVASVASDATPPTQTGTYALSWVRADGAEECPTGRALATEVERRLGRPVFDASAPRSFEVQVTRVAGVFHSDVFVRDESGKAIGQRALQSDEPGCAALFGATALAIALVIDPEAASRDPGARAVAAFDAPASPPPTPPPAAPPAPAPPAPEPDRRAVSVSPPPAPTLVTLSLRLHFSGALVPAVSPGFGIAFGARSAARWGFLVAGWYTMPQTGQQGLGDIEVGLTRLTAGVTFDVLRSRRVRVVLGAGPSLGALHVAVREPEPVTDAGDFSFIAAELGVTLQAAVSEGILMELGGAGLVPLRRQEFLARGQQEPIWRQPAVSGVAFAGLGTLFP